MCFAEYARTVLVAINRFCCRFKSRFLRVDCTGFYLVCTVCTSMTRDSSDDRFSPEAGRGRADRRKKLDGMIVSNRKWNDISNFIFFVRTSLFFLDSKRNVAPLEN